MHIRQRMTGLSRWLTGILMIPDRRPGHVRNLTSCLPYDPNSLLTLIFMSHLAPKQYVHAVSSLTRSR
jgi:hypothetical protein